MAVKHEDRKEYRAAYIRKHYANNKQYYIDRAAERRKVLIEYILTQKQKPCTDCKVSYPAYAMDFDHLGDKEYDISRMPARGFSIEKIQLEIDKCELVCANCHRERTHKRLHGSLV
jgi:hypothetical protein